VPAESHTTGTQGQGNTNPASQEEAGFSDSSTPDLQQSNGDIRVEITTVKEEEYYVQIQGSDRPYPAVVIRRKHRGEGATVTTVSKRYNSGKPNPAYADYEEAIKTYLDNRQKRLDRKRAGVGSDDESIPVGTGKEWLREAVQGVVK
jgi:hypothetical protein